MRLALIALCLSSGLAIAQQTRYVDLDRPGMLDAIEKENPAHYQKISAILDAAAAQPCETLPKLLKADYDANETRCSPWLLMASFPPKRHLSFQLDDVHYSSNVALVNLPKAEVKPAVPKAPLTPLK